MKKIFYLITIIISMLTVNVYASNTADYTLTITDNFKFKENIKYSITDYNKIQNGYNYFYDIINDNTYTDIFYKTPYTKTKTKKGNKYNVTLSHTYSEYTFSNSNLLNNCFEKSDYEYDMNKYSFSGTDGFTCLNADSLKITIITNMKVTSSNATVLGNKYIWTPQNENFTMNINIEKEYKDNSDSTTIEPGDYDTDGIDSNDTPDENTNNNPQNSTQSTDDQTDDTDNQKNSNPLTGIIIATIVLALSVGIIITVITLKIKKNQINKI